MNVRSGLAIAAGLVVVIVAAPAAAQGQQPPAARPYRGLFGGGIGETEQSLTFDAKIGGGYDGNVATASGSIAGTDPNAAAAPGSRIATTSESLVYGLSRKTFSLDASAAGWSTYYPSLPTRYVNGGSGGLRGAWTFTRRSTLTFQQTAAERPLYIIFPLASTAPAIDLPADTTPVVSATGKIDTQFTVDTSLGFSQLLTKRLSVSITGTRQQTNGAQNIAGLRTTGGSAGLGYSLTKGLSLRLGYNRTDAQYDINGTRTTARLQGIDGGVDFSHSLSLTRSTTLSFGVDTGAVNDGTRTAFRVNGNLLLSREIGRSWTASLGYGRNAQFQPTFLKPVLSDSVGITMSGFVSRRLNVSATAGATRGNIGLSQADNSFSNAYGTTGVTFGVSRDIGLTFNYSYVHADFSNAIALPSGLPRRLDRQSIRVTLDLWLPIYKVMRRSN
jgi:hypothetical protein